MRRIAAKILLGLGCCLASCGATAVADEPVRLWDLPLRGAEGDRVELPRAELTVVCFLGTECPLARLYGPRLSAMAERWAASDVVFLGVNSNVQDSPAEIVRYAERHGIEFEIVKDADQSLARRLDATRTPEVFVLDRTGRVRYRGRVDDQYQPGKARPEPTRHDLRDAIAALLDGRPVAQPRTRAVGCVITRVERGRGASPGAAEVTFTRDVAPILNRRCVECHREDNIGPFALADYDEVVGWGQMILEVIDQGRMPPWHADPRFGEFTGGRHVTADERDTIARWLDGGMPRGDADDLPQPPQWAGGWHLPTPPDVELDMRDRPFAVPAEGTLEYQYFVVDPGWDTDRWVRAAQVIPGDARVVHHTIVFVRPPDGSRFRGVGWIGGYVPGQRAEALPPGHARRIPAGSKLVFQMHYTPDGRETSDLTRLGVWFADAEAVTDEVFTRVAIDQSFEIPPGAADHPVALRMDSFPRASRLLAVMPHMHLRGKSFRMDVRRRDRLETVLSVPQYDFNWQHWYRFAEPLALDAVDGLEMTVEFDNSAANPVNPAPDEYVSWGDQTWEEMAVAFLDLAQPRELPTPTEATVERSAAEQQAEAEAHAARTRRAADRFLAEMDADGDGVVTRDEAPLAFRSFGFSQFDHDGDGRLDRREIEAAAARRQ